MIKENLWERQHAALRHPSEIFGTSFEQAGLTRDTISFKASPSFAALLKDIEITLIASREYENMIISLSAPERREVEQSFFHLPHPSGIAVDRKKNSMYVAATRNPNEIIEFRVSQSQLTRRKIKKVQEQVLLPARSKYYPGEYYFHDLALSAGKLYANSVGMNCIIEVDITSPSPEKPLWWPKCIEKNGKPDITANYIQLNSIAIGNDINSSFFSASSSKISARRPGHANYPVDKQGVIFSGSTRLPIAGQLTRPHSARIYKDKVWVANSGYGEVGYLDKGEFKAVHKFDGWTRGLCFINDILFVGISRVLPRFRQYAPGITSKNQQCGILAFDLKKNKIIGDIQFPFGNQIFAIDYFDKKGIKFPFNSVRENIADKKIFSVTLV